MFWIHYNHMQMVAFCQVELSPNYLGNVYPSSQADSTWMLDWHDSGCKVSSIILARLRLLPLDSQQVLVNLNTEILNSFLCLRCGNLWILSLLRLYIKDGQGEPLKMIVVFKTCGVSWGQLSIWFHSLSVGPPLWSRLKYLHSIQIKCLEILSSPSWSPKDDSY